MNLLTVNQVAEKLSCAVSWVWQLSSRDPAFPEPFSIGMGDAGTRKGTRWVESEIDEWLLTRKQGGTASVNGNANPTPSSDQHGEPGRKVHSAAGQEVEAQS